MHRRKYLYRFHAKEAAAIMSELGYTEAPITQVKQMIAKERIKRNTNVQVIESARG